MSSIAVTEYDRFVSFALEDEKGDHIFVQYHNDQVWKDNDGVWQVKEGEQPFHSFRTVAAPQPEVKLSPAIHLALIQT